MDAAARNLVRQRADNRCEYCLLRQEYSHLAHHIEHIVAKQHGGSDDLGNLALACHRCNLCKGPNLTGLDRESGRIVPLFHPRRDRWAEHFAWRGPRIEGLTAAGRATVLVLGMNDARRLDLRTELLARGELT
jgi:5-methylcytosine-specific restriction endonuclease McrA